MNRQKAYRAKAIAAQMDREQRAITIAIMLFATGLLISQLLLLISP